jgi:hypothetical protein
MNSFLIRVAWVSGNTSLFFTRLYIRYYDKFSRIQRIQSINKHTEYDNLILEQHILSRKIDKGHEVSLIRVARVSGNTSFLYFVLTFLFVVFQVLISIKIVERYPICPVNVFSYRRQNNIAQHKILLYFSKGSFLLKWKQIDK